MGGREGDPQPFGGQQHHHIGGVGLLGEELGVTAERDASLVDDPLVHPARSPRRQIRRSGCRRRRAARGQHIGAVALIQLAWHHGGARGTGQTVQSPARCGTGRRFGSWGSARRTAPAGRPARATGRDRRSPPADGARPAGQSAAPDPGLCPPVHPGDGRWQLSDDSALFICQRPSIF